MHSVLAARTNFSIGESIYTVEKLIEDSKKAGAKAIAITDTMSITGMIDFTNKAKKAEVKPIIGVRLRLVDDPTWKKPKGQKAKAPPEYFATLYIKSQKGLDLVYRMLTLANSDERFYNVPKLGFSDLFEHLMRIQDLGDSKDLAIATGDAFSVLTHPEAESIVAGWVEALGPCSVYATLTPIDAPLWDTLNAKTIALASKLSLPTLVTRPVAYPKDQSDAQEIMSAVTRNVKVSDMWHWQSYWRDLHPLSDKELVEQVKGAAVRLRDRYGVTDAGNWFKAGLQHTDTLANDVTYLWEKQAPTLPVMAPDEFEALKNECIKGFKTRFATEVFGHKPGQNELEAVYRPRLVYELSVLKKLGFAGYFLLVQDVVRFAKSSGILVGPGRGSVGGSLVAYLMGITDCDPIRFDLLFERFINPDRQDLPDADLDFMSERRHEVVAYLVEKYGQERVAGISNFGTLAGASAMRDVSRVFGLEEREYSASKMMPKNHGQNVPLVKAAEAVPEIAAFRDKYDPLWGVMLQLEGVMRNLSQHAAGIVVGGTDLVERAVLERRKGETVVCWDKRIVEDQGLVKMDILGLSTLDLIDATLKYIRQRHSKRVDLMKIPLDDQKVLAAFGAGQTTGIFQFESGGMRRLLKELGKDGVITFDDITAATALYRPGPMESGMMDSYWKRKQGLETVEYDHPLMEPILKPTFGVMVYQEQVMQVSRAIAGYSAPDADKLRKIMGKKLPEEMAKERGKFVKGVVATVGESEEWAGELFDKIEGFAGYGFNKSHSVEYTLISYQSMWLKVNFPVEFFAAALSLMKEEKLPAILREAERLGIEIDLPDINLSTNQFEIITDTRLAIPFNRVKGISDNTASAIMEARKAGPFKSMADLEARVERRKCNARHRELLNRIGAFARIEPGQIAAKHPDRIKDQVELIPGLITDVVPVNRDMHTDKHTRAKVALVMQHARENVYNLAVKPHVKEGAKFMVIFDGPTKGEEDAQFFAFGGNWDWIGQALREHDLCRNDGYWTGLIKRPKEGKTVSPAEVTDWAPYLKKELELLKPPVIVLLGSTVVRHFIPDFKGKASDVAGKVIYSQALDANVVIGFNPGEIYHDPDKQTALNEVFGQVASIIL